MKPIIFLNSRKVRSFYCLDYFILINLVFYSIQTVLETPPIQNEDENDVWSHGFITNDIDNQQARYSYLLNLLNERF